MQKENEKICFNFDELIKIAKEIETIMISLNKQGYYYSKIEELEKNK